MNIKIYGSRGSMPFSGRDNVRYGGNTSCVKVETGGREIILDCGSGLMQFLNENEHCGKPLRLDILISHLHIDHIIGLSTFFPLWSKDNDIRIYTKSRDSRPLSSQIFGIFKPPYWPVDLEKMNRAELIEIKEDLPFEPCENVRVTAFASNHYDGTTAFRIDSEKSVVYLMDYETEKNPAKYEELALRCENADVIIYDSSYLPEDFIKRTDWGHSVYSDGIVLAEKSKCRRMIFSHFDPKYSDIKLDSILREIDGRDIKYFTAFDGMELCL